MGVPGWSLSALQSQHWSCHITHPIPGDYGSILTKYVDEKAGNDRAGEELLGLERNSQVLVQCVSFKGSARTCNSAPNLPQVVPVS